MEQYNASSEALDVMESQPRSPDESQAMSDQRGSVVPLRFGKALCRSLQSLLPAPSLDHGIRLEGNIDEPSMLERIIMQALLQGFRLVIE